MNCMFPKDDYHDVRNQAPCLEPMVDTLEISTPGGLIVVPVCEYHYYVAMKLYPRDLVEMIEHRQFFVLQPCPDCGHPIFGHMRKNLTYSACACGCTHFLQSAWS